jgi:F0F1-type ATP synthase assembly protein I
MVAGYNCTSCKNAQSVILEIELPKDDSNWGLLIGVGSQVLVGVVMGLLAGQWLDKKFGWAPWGLIVCTLLGVTAGMYSMIREGMRVNRDPPKSKPPGSGQN